MSGSPTYWLSPLAVTKKVIETLGKIKDPVTPSLAVCRRILGASVLWDPIVLTTQVQV